MTLSDLRFPIASALSRDVALTMVDDLTAQVYVPFYFPDGDGLVVRLRSAGGDAIEVTDEAHTFMHLGYHSDVDAMQKGTRGELLENIKLRHQIEDRDGELVASTTRAGVGQAVFGFVQALVEIIDLRHLSRDAVKNSFREDVAEMLSQLEGIEVNHVDRKNDPDELYPIPYLLNGVGRPVAVYDVNNNERATDAVLTVEKHRSWGRNLLWVAIERDQTELRRKDVARLSDAFDKQFATMTGHEQSIVTYIREAHDRERRASASDAT